MSDLDLHQCQELCLIPTGATVLLCHWARCFISYTFLAKHTRVATIYTWNKRVCSIYNALYCQGLVPWYRWNIAQWRSYKTSIISYFKHMLFPHPAPRLNTINADIFLISWNVKIKLVCVKSGCSVWLICHLINLTLMIWFQLYSIALMSFVTFQSVYFSKSL